MKVFTSSYYFAKLGLWEKFKALKSAANKNIFAFCKKMRSWYNLKIGIFISIEVLNEFIRQKKLNKNIDCIIRINPISECHLVWNTYNSKKTCDLNFILISAF